MNIIRGLTHLVNRYKKGEESFKSISLRLIFWINKYRYDQVKVVEEQWNNLIVLDACRYDLFQEASTSLNGELEGRYSLGTHTVEWMKNNFDTNIKDVVYVSGNPQVSSTKLKEWTGINNPFYHLENVWDSGWDEEQSTVPPEEVVEATKQLKGEYPNKRFIVHFLQPHHPFIGKETLKTTNHQNGILNSMDWRPVFDNFSLDEIRDSFRKNLDLVLRQVEKLIEDLNGKTVITADHGEMFGEYGLYGHIPGMYTEELVKVPWLEVRE